MRRGIAAGPDPGDIADEGAFATKVRQGNVEEARSESFTYIEGVRPESRLIECSI